MSLSSHSLWVCGVWRGDRLAELGMTGVRLIDVGGWIGALVLSLTRLLDRSFGSFFHSLAGSKGAFWFSLSLCCSFSRSLCVLSLALFVLFFLSLSLLSFSQTLCVLRDPKMI